MVKSKNGARQGYNLSAGTVTNDNLHEEMEVPEWLVSETNL